MKRGLLAEFESAEACSHAIRALRSSGLSRIDAYMPYPAKEVQKALEIPASPLPRYVLSAGALGAALAYFILWYTDAYDYPINVGGRPNHPVPAFIPITFETLVLFAGCVAFVGALVLGGLPRLYHPIDELEGFSGVFVDRFMLAVDAADDAFKPGETSVALRALGAVSVRALGDLGTAGVAPEQGAP